MCSSCWKVGLSRRSLLLSGAALAAVPLFVNAAKLNLYLPPTHRTQR